MRIRHAAFKTYLGWVMVAATQVGVCSIAIGDSPAKLEEELRRRFPRARFEAPGEDFKQTTARILAYLETPHAGSLDLPLDIRGTAFQLRVWQALRQIKSGNTATYGEIAGLLGKPSAARAVARACGANPVAVAIPCHRVVRSDGSLGGYRWGKERKRLILENERRRADR
jgi:AraC family transcriptional regulator of adaptative response/methylated-DNA-[protein]-cysteine methyltransferase